MSRALAVVIVVWLEGHTNGMAPVVAPPAPTVRLDHPGGVHFDPLKAISFIPCLRDGPNGSYPSKERKEKTFHQ